MADPASAMMAGTAMQGGQALVGGAQGKRAAGQADKRQSQYDQRTDYMLDTGTQAVEGAMDFMGRTGGQLDRGGDILDAAMTGGRQFSGRMNDLAGDLQGATPAYDFAQGSGVMDQAMAQFDRYAQGQRDTALEQAGSGMRQTGDALDAALASRGLSRDSGVAAGAMGDFANQAAQQRVGLERDLAAQGGQLGLEATQFDVNRVLQEQGMGSQFALGAGAQRGQNLANAGNMYSQGYTQPLAMQQDIYATNVLNPYMNTQQGLMGLVGQGMAAMGQGQQLRNDQVANAGAGKGAAMGGITDPARASGKGA